MTGPEPSYGWAARARLALQSPAMRMRYLLYTGRDGQGAVSFVKRMDEAPPHRPGLRLEIVGAYLNKDDAERALRLVEAIQSLLRYAQKPTAPPK